VDFVDSTVISTLVGAYRTAQRTGRTFTVVGARGHVGKVLGVAGVLPALTSPPG
jgi:anti-anti-sigma regulatory factor